MSEKMTRIRIAGFASANGRSPGLMDWGEKSYEDMVYQFRRYAARMIEEGQTILDVGIDGYEVDVVRGPIVQHHVRKVLPK